MYLLAGKSLDNKDTHWEFDANMMSIACEIHE